MQKAEDQNVRKIVVGKDCYSKYCVKCSYCIKAEWSPKEGFKYGWIDVYCCMNSGKCNPQSMCPNGIGWDICLGEAFEFDPEKIWKPMYIPVLGEGLVDVSIPKKQWWKTE